jgi:Tol biopolymer transport system component
MTLVLLLGLVLAPATSVSSRPVPAWALKGVIVDKCGDSLCLVRPDGSASHNLLRVAHPWPQWDAAVSPAGTMVAFRGYYGLGDGAYALYVVRTDGCAVRRLTGGIAGNPSWSPDAKWIVFDTSGAGAIWKVHPDGTRLTRIAISTGANYDASPAWSPNRKTIAFIHYHQGRGQIWTMRPDGSGARLLHGEARGSDETPVWSHDGRRIAFTVQTAPHARIDLMDADGTHLHTLTGPDAWNPIWLPDDAGIAYLSPANSSGRVFVMRPNGTDVHRLPIPETEQLTWTSARLARPRC